MVSNRIGWYLSLLLHAMLLPSLFLVTTKTGQPTWEKVIFVSLDTIAPVAKSTLPRKDIPEKNMTPELPKEIGSISPGISQTSEPLVTKIIDLVPQPKSEEVVVPSIASAPFSVNLDTNSPSLSLPSLSGITPLDFSPYFVSVRRHILKKIIYPEIARRRGWEGAVKVTFILDQEGRLKEKKVADSSGYEVLDTAALQSLVKAEPFPPFPSQSNIKNFFFFLTIRYQLQ